MRKVLKGAGFSLLIGFVVIQFVRPERSNPTVDPTQSIDAIIAIPDSIRAILRRACRDCHSHETVWPWYSHVAPVSWLVVGDVNEGRSHLNLSRWGEYSRGKMAEKLSQMAEEVSEGSMPLPPYTWLHPEARLSDQERKVLGAWAEGEGERIFEKEESGDE